MRTGTSSEVAGLRGSGGAEERRKGLLSRYYAEERVEAVLRTYRSPEIAAINFRAQGLTGIGSLANAEYEELIRDIYLVHRPEKMPKLPELLVKYEGLPGGLAAFAANAIEKIVIPDRLTRR